MQTRIEDPAAWPRSVASAWERRLRLRSTLRMAVPTGSTPVPVYEAMTERAVSFADATVFLLDEFGGLPPGHPQRCDTMIRPFVEGIDLPPDRLVRLDPDVPDLAAECDRYQRLVDDGGLDLVLLGLGSNGHLGLNEPGADPGSTTRVVELTEATIVGARDYGGEGSPTFGMTMGMSSILASKEAWLLVTGESKREILARVLEEPVDPSLPASLLRRHPNATLWADELALPS